MTSYRYTLSVPGMTPTEYREAIRDLVTRDSRAASEALASIGYIRIGKAEAERFW